MQRQKITKVQRENNLLKVSLLSISSDFLPNSFFSCHSFLVLMQGPVVGNVVVLKVNIAGNEVFLFAYQMFTQT